MVTIVVLFSRRILHGDLYFLVFLKFASHTRLACLASKLKSIFANERTGWPDPYSIQNNLLNLFLVPLSYSPGSRGREREETFVFSLAPEKQLAEGGQFLSIQQKSFLSSRAHCKS